MQAYKEQPNLNSALNEVFETHREALYGYINKRIQDCHIADDILQDLFIKLQTKQFEEIKYPKAYLYRMVNNLIIDEQRRQARFVDTSLQTDGTEFCHEFEKDDRSPEVILSHARQLSHITSALKALPDKTRDVFCLLRLKQMEKQHVAHQLNISVNMVEKHLRKALAICHNALKKPDT